MSFGGPEGPDDVMPFLRNVTRGRNVPDERLALVATQYEQFGGRSPINDQNRSLIAALTEELESHGIDLPIYWGNRNWEPFVQDTVEQMTVDGISNALVFVTSAFGSYSGCRQYREDLLSAAEAAGNGAPSLQKLRLFYNHPGFLEPAAERVHDALRRLGDAGPDARLVFTAHSIPVSMAQATDYEAQLREAAQLIVDLIEPGRPWDLVYQSRSGPPHIPWLEPDIGDHLAALAQETVDSVVVTPLGFISDHMEVMYDLDSQAADIARDLGLRMERASTVGIHPRFVSMIRELIEEQLTAAPKLFLGPSGPWPDWCPEGHCIAAARPGRPG